ncbi:MAG: 2-hydroxychromene-2-carboxylate isomerase [Myxococcales bacterium]|nr:2-hydroxychromene-2-carboxylate isomerase [Myxococcales bacterium]
MTPRIELFFDVVSPYSYLAVTQIEALAERHGAEVDFKPFFLAGVMKATGNVPPATLPARGKYLFADLNRWAKRYGVPFRFPSSFPAKTITAQRMLVAQRLADAAGVPKLAHALYRAHWGEGGDVAAPERLVALAEGAGLDGEALLAAAGTPEVKAELEALTADAVARGAFGAPTLFVGREMFFGNDRLGLLEDLLESLRAAPTP